MRGFVVALLLTMPLTIATTASAGVNERFLVSTEWLAKKVEARRVKVVHVGTTRDAYDTGHVPTSLFLPLEKIAATRGGVPAELPTALELQKVFEDLGIGDRGRIVITGDDPLQAARLFFTLDYLGHGDRVALLDGGLAKWKAEGRPLEKGLSMPSPARFTARVRPDVLVYLSQLRKLVPSDTMVVIDARPPSHYAGTESGDGVPRGGHIPGAVNLHWKDTLTENGTLKPIPQLEQQHGILGVSDDTPVITYCRTGMQSSWSYFVLRYLGYAVSMYDGSFIEWSNDPATNVE